ncbi:hypothetical protein [Mesoaciditoga lauensis]|uniref:hypothetical protein n=1 Tax=Mesoaciditoga lauensis TaxID=1495039 RepID=UPI00056C2941|nr:hypothetical protein [Mesoaciditoga lauensis]
MGKKVIGLAVTVALLMVVLSGCFLLPKPDTVPPTVSVVYPQNGGNIVVTSGSANLTVKASVTAHSPIQSVTFTLTSSQYPQIVVDAQGDYGKTSGVFTYTFTNLKPGTYTLSVKAYSSARFPGRAVTTFSVANQVKNPEIGSINLTPNYQGAHFVTKAPINFSAMVTNPNNTGNLNVTATVNGEAANFVSSNNGVYTFTYTPNEAGSYKFEVTALLTVGTETYTNSTSTTIDVYDMPEATITSSPEDYSVATSPVSFGFTTTAGVKAYLSINGSTHSLYTSGSSINSYLAEDKWNNVTLAFEDPWGNPIKDLTVHILGTKESNPNDTPYVFLIDKDGHVVNTNDWIHVAAGSKIDLYGYILKGKVPISDYDITESYYPNENLTPLATSGTVVSEANLNEDKVPLRLVAYLFNEAATDTFIKFDINVNDSAIAFLRYDVSPVAAGSLNVTLSPAGDTYEGVPATLNVTVNSIQPLTSIALDQPFKVGEPFDGYATTTAYSNKSSNINERNTNVMTFNHKLIVPVSDVEENGAAAYGTLSGTFPFEVAFYGPSGMYQIGATVDAVAAQSKYATTTYKVQADTAAPTIKIVNKDTNSVVINGQRVYYGPMSVVATVTDDHAIYWANFDSKNASITSTIIKYPNDSSISNYGVTEVSTTATVTFGNTGAFTIWGVASDKHFDPTEFTTGNTANSVMSISGIYDNNAPTASVVGGQYDADVNSEKYAFVVSASDGNGVGLSQTAIVNLIPVGGVGTQATSIQAQLSASGSTPTYYNATINTYKLTNKTQYKVVLGIKDKVYDALIDTDATDANKHITWVDWGYITVDHVYPNVGLYAGEVNPFDGSYHQTLDSTSATTVQGDVFTVGISNDPYFPWAIFAENDYNQLLNYVNVQIGTEDGPLSPAMVVPLKVSQTSTQSGYFSFEIVGLYQNAGYGINKPATRTIQVSVYNSIQPDKALFGQTLSKIIPNLPFNVTFSKTEGIKAGVESASTPLIWTTDTYTISASVTGLDPNTNQNMQLIFMVNDEKALTVNPAANGTYSFDVPVPAGTSDVSIRVLYAPTYYNVPGMKRVASSYNPPANYDYYRYFATLYILGDNVTPTSSIVVNGVDITNSSTILTSTTTVAEYSVNGVDFYLHDFVAGFATNSNTYLNGSVEVSTYSTPTFTTVSTSTLTATETLSVAGFTKGATWTISKALGNIADKAGVYKINFTAVDPLLSPTTANATVVVDLVAPGLTTTTSNATSGQVVPEVAEGDSLSVSATDDAGVKAATMTITNLLYANKVSAISKVMSLDKAGACAFNVAATGTVELPTYVGAEFQNLPYEVAFQVEDLGGHTTSLTRLFVTNVDHNPSVSNFVLQAPNKLLVRLPEPMWVSDFVNGVFTAYSTTFGGTITAVSIEPYAVLGEYNGNEIANQFVITFGYNVWNDDTGTNEWGDLSNVKMLDANGNPIRDLAGNVFVVPVSHTIIPPDLSVTPEATMYVGPASPVTFSIEATSSAGIKNTVGYFAGQTKVLNTPSGQLTFTAPNESTSTTLYATFVTTDKSLDANQASTTRVVYINAVKPEVSAHASPIIAADATLTVTGNATVGDIAGTNVIKSIVVENVTAGVTIGATFTENSTTTFTATLTGLTAGATNDITVTVTDYYGNKNVTTLKVYVDNSYPTITVSFAASHNNTEDITNGSSDTIYAATPATFSWKVTTDSGTTPEVKVNITGLVTDNSNASSSVSVTASNTYTITITATNPVSKLATTFIATRTVVIDNVAPEVNITEPATVLAASSTAIATYTATDAHFESAKLVISDAEGTLHTFDFNSASENATVDLRDYLDGLDGTTVTITLTATDLALNSSITSESFYVDTVNPGFDSVVASSTSGGTVINIFFTETVATTDAFTPNDIYFENSYGVIYHASDVTFNASCVTVEKFVNEVLPGELNGSWTVHVSDITDIAGNPVTGTGSYNNQ